jgi:plastocyanin
MKRFARLILAVAATAALLPPAGARAATIDVSIRSGGDEFHPSEIVVHVGDYVRWTNDDRTLFQTDHNVMADDGSFSSKQRMKEGTSFEFQFTAPGTFAYHCSIHGWGGTVEVVGPRPTRPATVLPTPTPTRTTRPKASKSATASATPAASPDASSAPSIGASGVGGSLSSSAGAIISIAIVSIVALALLGWFVYIRFVRQD